MSITRALVPLAIIVAIIAALVWVMLVNDIVLGPWLLAFLVLAHGWVHLMFVFPKPQNARPYADGGEYPFDFGRSWLVRRAGLDIGLVRIIGIVVMAVVFILAVLAALSTVGLIVPTDWWGALMVGTALASTLMLVLFYAPALLLGFAIDAAMVLLVASGSWTPS